MRFVLLLLCVCLLAVACTKPTSPHYIEKNCCNSSTTQWVLVQSSNDTNPASYFFLPQVFNPGSEAENGNFVSTESGVDRYAITIRLKKDIIWLYEGVPPINWNGNIAASGIPAQSGVYTYDLTATFTNGEVKTIKDQNFCLIREFATCPEDVTQCVLRSMFDINDTTAPTQYIKEASLLTTRLYDKCE
ncbi:hypothetical protein BH09BAC1_BH09BAC1_11350 [soil metagenome]